MKHQRGDIPYVYSYIHRNLDNNSCKDSIFLTTTHLIAEIKKVIRINKKLIYPIICQMEEYGLIERMNRQRYKLIENNKVRRKIDTIMGCNIWEF